MEILVVAVDRSQRILGITDDQKEGDMGEERERTGVESELLQQSCSVLDWTFASTLRPASVRDGRAGMALVNAEKD